MHIWLEWYLYQADDNRQLATLGKALDAQWFPHF